MIRLTRFRLIAHIELPIYRQPEFVFAIGPVQEQQPNTAAKL